MRHILIKPFLLFLLLPCFSLAENHLKIGAGTDASLGLALGGEYQLMLSDTLPNLRVGPSLYFNRWTETTEEFHTYEEESTTFIFGVAANYYSTTADPTLSFIGGGGIAFMLNDWQETSETDSSIGPLIDGFYTDEEEASGASIYLNVGVSKLLSESFALELNVPLFFIPTPVGTLIAPALTVSAVIPL